MCKVLKVIVTAITGLVHREQRQELHSAKKVLKTVQALVKWHTEKSKEMSQHIITLEKKRRCAGNTEAITNDLSRQLDEARSAYERERESTLEARQILDDLQTRRDEMRVKYAAVFKTEQTRPSEESDQLRLVKWRDRKSVV